MIESKQVIEHRELAYDLRTADVRGVKPDVKQLMPVIPDEVKITDLWDVLLQDELDPSHEEIINKHMGFLEKFGTVGQARKEATGLNLDDAVGTAGASFIRGILETIPESEI